MVKKKLSILLADDEQIVRKTIGDYLKESGHKVEEARDGSTAQKFLGQKDYDLALIDIRMPGMDGFTLLKKARETHPELSIVLITAHGNMETAIQALRYGATDFLTKPIKLLELDAVLEKSVQIRKLRQEKRHLRDTIKGMQNSDELRFSNRSLVGNSASTCMVREQIQQAVDAGLDTILLTGETGTGKEVVAREIHSLANLDRSSPFIAVSCPALATSLIESELFGHVRGAFTGATENRAGYFELADGGTLFLDEVGDLSQTAQATLLRVLETRTLRRVGGSNEIQVNVRVIAATNVELEKNVELGKFRRDLYYRLNIYSIHLLPLRERKEDIMPLAVHFCNVFTRSGNFLVKGFSAQAVNSLRNYNFPGNSRELKNIVERAVVLCKKGLILPEHLNLSNLYTHQIHENKIKTSPDLESSVILKALEKAKWNRRIAAHSLGMAYSTLRFKIQKFGLK